MPFRDEAYVENLPSGFPEHLGTHCIMVDIIEADGSVEHVMIASANGERAALADAQVLNQWKEQGRFQG